MLKVRVADSTDESRWGGGVLGVRSPSRIHIHLVNGIT